MKSRIVNLGNYRMHKSMDAEDRRLAELLAAPPLADDGFSERVMQRVNRRDHVRRWLLPAAAAIGGVFAAAPASRFLLWLGEQLTPGGNAGLAAGGGPLLQSTLTGLLVCTVAVAVLRTLEN